MAPTPANGTTIVDFGVHNWPGGATSIRGGVPNRWFRPPGAIARQVKTNDREIQTLRSKVDNLVTKSDLQEAEKRIEERIKELRLILMRAAAE